MQSCIHQGRRSLLQCREHALSCQIIRYFTLSWNLRSLIQQSCNNSHIRDGYKVQFLIKLFQRRVDSTLWSFRGQRFVLPFSRVVIRQRSVSNIQSTLTDGNGWGKLLQNTFMRVSICCRSFVSDCTSFSYAGLINWKPSVLLKQMWLDQSPAILLILSLICSNQTSQLRTKVLLTSGYLNLRHSHLSESNCSVDEQQIN